jgi:hypothetical protein
MELLNYFQPGWNIRLGSQRLVIDAPSEGAAFDLLASATDQLALLIANWRLQGYEATRDNSQLPTTSKTSARIKN